MDAAARRNLTLFAIGAAGSVALFVLPWYVPLPGPPVISDSYVVGFSNVTAAALLLVTALVLVLYSARAPGVPLDTSVWRSAPPRARRASRVTVAVLAAASVAVAAAYMWATRDVAYGESRFFLDRAAQLVAGNTPFVDFGYGYALGALYGPVWLWRAFRSAGLTPLMAYDVIYLMFLLVSWGALYLVTGAFELSDTRRAWLIACIGVVHVNAGLAIQYTLVRYLAPLLMLLAVHAWLRHRPRSAGRALAGGLAITAGGLAATLVVGSPEMAIAGALAAGTLLVVALRRDRRALFVTIVLLVVCLAAVAVLGRDYFSLVVSFARGAFNLPVLPGLPVLLYIVAVYTVAIWLPRVLRGAEPLGQALTLGCAVLGAALVPAAFGRADSGHILFNGLVVFLLAAVFLAHLRPRLYVPFLLTFVVVFAVAGFFGLRGIQEPLLRATATGGNISAPVFRALSGVLAWPAASARGSDPASYAWPAPVTDLGALDGYRSVGTPYGVSPADYLLPITLADQGRLALRPTGGGFTRDDLAADLAQLADADALLVPLGRVSAVEAAAQGGVPTDVWVLGAEETRSYGDLTLFPLAFYQKNPQPNLGGLLDAYVAADFTRVGTVGAYAIYERKPA